MANSLPALSAKVIVHNEDGDVLLLRRSEASKNNPGKWEFPGGKLDPGESFVDGLLREVREETGLDINLKGSFGICESKLAKPPVVYLVMEAEAKSGNIRLSHEHSKFQWTPPDKLEEMPICPQFRRVARRYAQEVKNEPRVEPGQKQDTSAGKDLFKDSVVEPTSLERHLEMFADESTRDRLTEFSQWLEAYLTEHVRAMFPLADVGARPKGAVSFATKLIKKNKYKDPLHEMTDLVGARIIVHLQSEVDAVCRWIERTFEIDKPNSGDKLKDLGAEKFGYRSVHYVVEIQPKKPAGVPNKFRALKAEIQVRTIAQHAWSDIGHDRVYKADCEIPDYWKREANRIAALLEAADDAFARLVNGVSAFEDHVRQSPDLESAQRAMALWRIVQEKLPGEPQPALRVARLALEMEEWEEAVEAADRYAGAPNTRLLCAKGYALCKTAKHSHADEWKQGVTILQEAAKLDDGNIEPYLRLGELLAPEKRIEALGYYERAFAIDPSNPTVLAGYIRCKVLEEKTTAFIPLLRLEIEQAIKRSQELVAAGADLPHALYRTAGFHLLLGRTHCHESLDMLALAVHRTQTRDPLVSALRDVSELARLDSKRDDIECARRFLATAWLAKFPQEPWPEDVAKPPAKPLEFAGPFVIVAGGCDAYRKEAMKSYEGLLEAAFADFEGTIISGGTKEGISGAVGKLARSSGNRIRAVGYLPKSLPTDGTAHIDTRYDKHRQTDAGEKFTAREPIQNWLDLLATGVYPRDVRVLGINGGDIAGLEYRMAVALGATVGVIQDSGREAERVLVDWPAWPGEDKLPPSQGQVLPLPADPATLRAFLYLRASEPEALPSEAVDNAAKLVHQDFLEQQRYSHPNPVMQPWRFLRGDLQGSNRHQIEYMVSILHANGFGVRPYEGIPNDPAFTEDEIKRMGEMEHGRWNVERLRSGWRHAKKKDVEKRLSPYLVSWTDLDKLDKNVKKWDYLNVRLWPEVLAEVGHEVYRLSDGVPAAGATGSGA